MNAADALPFLHAGQKTSTDELALIALGPLPPTDMKGEEVTIPCTNPHGHQVLLHGKMFQLGVKDIQINKGATTQIQSDACQLFAITFVQRHMERTSMARHHFRNHGIHQAHFASRCLRYLHTGHLGEKSQTGKSSCFTSSGDIHSGSYNHWAFGSTKDDAKVRIVMACLSHPKLPSGRVATDFRVIWTKNWHGEILRI